MSSSEGFPYRLNRTFLESDVRIGICGVIPHPFAAFSGGGKIVLPGLASLDVLARTHKFALMGLKGGHRLEGNRFRTEMEDVVRRAGLQWTINVAINERREPVGVTAGDLVAAHRAAVKAAERTGATSPPEQPLDALVLNAYPKDGELLQIEAAFVALRSGMMKWLRPGAPVVLTASCVDGLGHHGLFGPGGLLFRTPGPKTFLADHPLLGLRAGGGRRRVRDGVLARVSSLPSLDGRGRAPSDTDSPSVRASASCPADRCSWQQSGHEPFATFQPRHNNEVKLCRTCARRADAEQACGVRRSGVNRSA